MKIVHISAECFPIAKIGGLADVVGSLPKYQNELGANSAVIMPFYKVPFSDNQEFDVILKDTLALGHNYHQFRILKLKNTTLGFELFCVDIPGLLDKEYVYSENDTERFLAFQIATLDWIITLKEKPTVIHIHDHHTGLTPFMITQSFKYSKLKNIPTILTIHNAQYQGWFSHEKSHLIPPFNYDNVGLLDWDGSINPLATAIKCAWKVTTVSPSYMNELKKNANGLEQLLNSESKKCVGILNGIDWSVWNTETDIKLEKNYTKNTVISGKKVHKKILCNQFKLNPKKPLFVFIGRLVGEKGADLFPEIFTKALEENDISILLLGSGHKEIEIALSKITNKNYNNYIGYSENLAHTMYAGADFILMPSRVEPCGLNQMYALRYGTVPIVNEIGGLKDTVTDIDKNNGFGITHKGVTISKVVDAIKRASIFYKDTDKFRKNQKQIMTINNSWTNSAKEYLSLYKSLIN